MGDSEQILPDQSQFGPNSLEWYFLSIRNKNQWILNMSGERILLYKRRYEGQRCPLFDTIRHTSAQHEDKVCYGTGWIAQDAVLTGPNAGGPYYGYFQPIEIVVSLISSAPDQLALTDYGQQRVYAPMQNWTSWEPLLTSGDMIVRRNNQRFFITEVFPHRWKHYVLHQSFAMTEIERGSIVYTLPSGL
jgi:hypothetical protein